MNEDERGVITITSGLGPVAGSVLAIRYEIRMLSLLSNFVPFFSERRPKLSGEVFRVGDGVRLRLVWPLRELGIEGVGLWPPLLYFSHACLL